VPAFIRRPPFFARRPYLRFVCARRAVFRREDNRAVLPKISSSV
jgi:hypothetical protein